MKPLKLNRELACCSAALILFAGASGDAIAQTPEELEMIRDNWIFVFKDSVAPHAVHGFADQAVASVGGERGHVYERALRGFSARMPAHAAARLADNNPHIAYYEADQIARVVAPPPWAAKKPSNPAPAEPTVPDPQTIPWGITRVNGGGIDTASGTAWVIDTGIDVDHPDLNVDTGRSINFVPLGRKINYEDYDDGNGHGTHVAGTIAAIDNTIGVIGVAPGATVVAVRVLNDNGSGTYSGIIAGIDYVADNGSPGDVANMSLGGDFSQALNDAVIAASATVKFVLAAGNESTDADTRSPASAEGLNIYTVSAMGEGDVWAYFSNYGNPPIDCAAPGVAIYSTYKDGGYATLSGTSMAAPHVAGILLLGDLRYDRTVSGDPDRNADPICVH